MHFIVDKTNKKEFLSYKKYLEKLDKSFDNQNTILINILSNIDSILEELYSIVVFIRTNYSKTDKKINFNSENLIKFSPIFNNIYSEISNYAQVCEQEYKELLKKANTSLIKSQITFSNEIETNYYDSIISFFYQLIIKLEDLHYQISMINNIDYDLTPALYNPQSKKRMVFATSIELLYDKDIELPYSVISRCIFENDKYIFLSDYLIENNTHTLTKQEFINRLNRKNIIELQIYNVENVIGLIDVLLYEYKISKVKINKCFNCGRFFVPTIKSNEKYCDRISPQNSKKTCKEYGMRQTYKDNIVSSPVKFEHNKALQFFRMRIKRCLDINLKDKYEKAFNKYKKDYKINLKKYDNGTLTEEDFKNWIEEQKQHVKEAK